MLEKRTTAQKKRTNPEKFSRNSPQLILGVSEKKSKTEIGF